MSAKFPVSKGALAASVAGILAAGLIAPVVWGQSEPSTPSAGQAVSSSFAVSPDPATEVAQPVQPGKDLLWQVTTLTTVAGQDPTTTTASVCLTPEELATPPVEISGPQCEPQMFNAVDHTVSWTNDCEAVKGTGSLNYAADGQSFAGDITVGTSAQDASLHVDGVVTGTCTKTS